MAYELSENKQSELAREQASCLPDLVWTYEATSEAFTQSRLMYRAFRAWNFANKHGFKIHGLLYRGEPLNDREVERFNLWIQGGGAMAAQNMEHHEAERLFLRIRG